MPIHLEPGPDNVHWGYFDARLSPRVAIDSGERVTISSVSGGPELMPGPPLVIPPALPAIHAKVVRQLGPHILTGPVAVKGAKPGQVLQVDIEAIDVLVKYIDYQPGRIGTSLRYKPAVRGLIQIGEVAISKITEALMSGRSELHKSNNRLRQNANAGAAQAFLNRQRPAERLEKCTPGPRLA